MPLPRFKTFYDIADVPHETVHRFVQGQTPEDNLICLHTTIAQFKKSQRDVSDLMVMTAALDHVTADAARRDYRDNVVNLLLEHIVPEPEPIRQAIRFEASMQRLAPNGE